MQVREKIIELMEASSQPVDAVFLTEKIGVNKTSVYRELQNLITHGEICEAEFGDGKKRYELASLDHHHHLVCTNCKSVADVKLQQDLDAEERRIEQSTGFKVERHSLEFFGKCSDCRASS